MSKRVEHVTSISQGYLATPASREVINKVFGSADDILHEHPYGWYEGAYYCADIYPEALNALAEAGVAFSWEFDCTEDFHYGAYNFPTEDNLNNLVIWDSSTKRKGKPRLSRAALKKISDISATNELLLHLGIKNGSN